MTTSSPSTTQAAAAPRSWAEDLTTYRDARGGRSLAAVASVADAPPRFARTTLVPLAVTGKLDTFGCDTSRSNPELQADRWNKHGWGDTTLLKEEGFAGTLHPRGAEIHRGKAMPPPPYSKDGRADLFGTLQYTEAGLPDGWIGNALVHPSGGKGAVATLRNMNGQGDILGAVTPGAHEDDAWLGNPLMHPGMGKAKALGPEQRRGRRDLREIYHHSILAASKDQQTQLLQKGGDPLADGWIGHPLISFDHGKRHVAPASGGEALQGATFRKVPEGYTGDEPRRQHKFVPAPQDTAGRVLRGDAEVPVEQDRRTKKQLPEPPGPTTLRRNDNLYAHMQFRPLEAVETAVLSKSLDDARHYCRRHCPVPQSTGPGQGREMLHWKPDTRIASYIPHGGMAQEQTRSKLMASVDSSHALARA